MIATPVGQTITFKALGDAISRPVEGGTAALQSALHKALADDGMVFENVRTVGYRRLSDVEIVDASSRDVRTIRRAVKRSARKLALADPRKLTDEKRHEMHARISVMAAIGVASSTTTERAVLKAVNQQGGELPLALTLEAFKQN
jgi:hypothetical protein